MILKLLSGFIGVCYPVFRGFYHFTILGGFAMNGCGYPVLKGSTLFRAGEHVYLNRSDELKEYCGRMHRHDFIEIAYVISGKGVHVAGDNRYDTCGGDLFIINYDVEHGFFPTEGGRDELVLYNCVFTPDFLDHSLLGSVAFKDIASSYLLKSILPGDYAPEPDLRLKGHDSREIGALFGKMYQEYKQRKKGYIEIIRAYLIQLLVSMFRKLEKPEQTGYSGHIINSAVEYLRENYSREIRLEEIAMKSFISKNYFSRLFKEATGVNFRDYVQRLRIEEACRMLRTSRMKVVDVAQGVGFNDLKSFYEAFKKITGSTPGDYRRG